MIKEMNLKYEGFPRIKGFPISSMPARKSALTPREAWDAVVDVVSLVSPPSYAMMKHLAPPWLGQGNYAVRLIDVDLGKMDAGDKHYILTYYPSFLSKTKGEENDLVWRSIVAASTSSQ